MKNMEYFASQNPCPPYSSYFDLNIWFRAWKVLGTLDKRAPGPLSKASRRNLLEK